MFFLVSTIINSNILLIDRDKYALEKFKTTEDFSKYEQRKKAEEE